MKFFRIIISAVLFVLIFVSCKQDAQKKWDISVEVPQSKIQVTDISKEFFDGSVSLEQFNQKYPWFQGSVSDEDFAKRRTNPEEIKLYKEAIAKINTEKLSTELGVLFGRIKYFFPKFTYPKVYLFSSSTQMYQDPILYDSKQGYLFIDISCFMGEKNPFYSGIEEYFKKSMNPENMLPKISESIASQVVVYSNSEQKFIDQMVYYGKIMTLQDAWLPDTPDHLKMSATAKQWEWNKGYEVNIWDFFVENDYIYSPDPRLLDRFILPAPFSKFYTEIDKESSPQVGVFIGWQICRKYFEKNPEVTLEKFLQMPATEIFNNSNYKPKN